MQGEDKMAVKLLYYFGNSYLERRSNSIPNPYAGIGNEPQTITLPLDLEGGEGIILTKLDEDFSLNLAIFEPIYASGGRVNIDKYKLKPKRFSIEGSIVGIDTLIVERYKYVLDVITREPMESGGLDTNLSEIKGYDVPAPYIKKVYIENGQIKKTFIIRFLRESLQFSYIPQLGFRGATFSITAVALRPFWEVE